MTLKDLRKRVYTLLAEDESSDRVTESTVTFALNSAYRELAKRARVFSSEIVIAAVNEQASYLLPGNMPEVKQVRYGGNALELTFANLLDRNMPHWREAAAGNPQYYLREDVRFLRLYPAPLVSETATISVVGLVYPASFASEFPLLNLDADVPALPEEFHEVLADYAIFDIAAKILADDPGAQVRGQAGLCRFNAAVPSLSAYLGGV